MTKSAKEPNEPQKETTKDRIRQAAMQEFSAEGFAGARVDRIANKAGVNIRMIYYFFGSKEALLKDVMSDIGRQRRISLPDTFEHPSELLASFFDSFSDRPDAVRLLVWEALQTPTEAADMLTNYEERRDVIKKRIKGLKALQKKGLVPDHLDPKLLYLFIVALTIYSTTFPQTVFTTTGKYPSNKTFKKQYSEFLRQIGELLVKGARKS
jgi:TetR/AcrR family transcriptional regulator